VAESRPSRSKPGRGLIFTRMEAINQNDVTVLSLLVLNMIGPPPPRLIRVPSRRVGLSGPVGYPETP